MQHSAIAAPLYEFLKPIAHLLDDPNINEIMINAPTSDALNASTVWIERNGRMEQQPITLNTDDITTAAQMIAYRLNTCVDALHPILDSRLPDGSRVAVIVPPCSLNGPTMTIRKFQADRWTLDALLQSGAITPALVNTVQTAIDNRQNILIAGGTGTGKTTLLNALATLIPQDDRLLIIEDTAEIQIKLPHIIRFEARNAIHNTADSKKSISAVTVRDLLKAALRHRPDRIILGEIRGTEAADLLQALNTGHGGTFSTIHADSAYLALERLKDLVVQSAENIKAESAFRSISHAIHLVLFIERRQGRRYVKEALRICGFNTAEGEIITETIYTYNSPQASTTSLCALDRATAVLQSDPSLPQRSSTRAHSTDNQS